LLVPVVQVAATISREKTRRLCLLAAAAYLAIDAVAAAQLAHEAEYFCFIWMTPTLLLAYLGLRRPFSSALIRSDYP
jgi:hypothetical protein